ncbi:enoyl-CoA delta isomerase 1, peroxisomal-like [Apium graveolens]|uniref:enoyl-CoA delta isomerase 1, peroxisomal-like n=1 Tax=Apium graveolens TaxID=4045 RepID=UPI003D7AD104
MCTLRKLGNVYILTLTGEEDHRLIPSLVDSISAALQQIRSETTARSSPCVALITTGEGKFFTNGGDIAWAQSDKNKILLMMSKIRCLLVDFMSLPMPTIAAVNGHVSATGYLLALCHDYVLMRKDRGFLYMNELDNGVVLTATYFRAVLRAKISSPSVWRDVVLKAEKMTAERAVEKGIIDAAYDTVEETVAAAVELGEQLVKRNWNGKVYAENRKILFHDVLHELNVVETDEMLRISRLPVEEVKSRL